MNDEIITFMAQPALSKMVYLKTALIVLGIILVIHLWGQWRVPPLIDYRISLVVCLALGGLVLYGLTRTPFTQSLKIDYGNQKVLIEYMTLLQSDNTLEIPFNELRTKNDTSFGTTAYGAKWKIYLLYDQKQVYSLTNREPNFSEEQLNDFIEKVKACEKAGT